MPDSEIRRIRRPATADQRERIEKHREEVERDLPDLRREARKTEAEMRSSAMLEPTVSGQLRRAISESGIDHRELAGRTALSPKTLAEFLVGMATLDSGAIDKIAALLKQELTPIG
jgi:ribosome-binding protein aMBF1 (putative translation factor)